MNTNIVIPVPNFELWTVGNWVLFYCCVTWFIGFFVSMRNVRLEVEKGEIKKNDKASKVGHGLSIFVCFPILLPIILFILLIYLFGLFVWYFIYIPLRSLYDF